MDYETQHDDDVIHGKLCKTIEKSNNLLHKKAIALVKGLKEQLGYRSIGLEGIKNYIKNLLDLVDVLNKKLLNLKNYKDESMIEEDIRNLEALVFTLAVCIKQIPFALLRNEKIFERLMLTVEKVIKTSALVPKKIELKKYSMIIVEKLLLSRNEVELKDDNDPIVRFFLELLFNLLDDSLHSGADLQKCLIKNLSKILKTPNMMNILKMSILLQIKNYLILKIRGLNFGKDYGMNNNTNTNTIIAVLGYGFKIKQLNTSEGESILKFMCSILQFLPFEIVNELILELTELIVASENKHVLLNSLLCFEVAFNTKNFALETSEKIIKLLLGKDFLINNTNEDNNKEESYPSNDVKAITHIDIDTSLTIAYMKSTTGVLLNLSKLNIFLGMKHFTSVFSLLGEFLTSNDQFLRSSVFNCLQNMFNSLMSKKNMVMLFTSLIKKSKSNEINIDPNDLTFEINISGAKEESNIMDVLESISVNMLYLTSDRFDDIKLGFNLLHNFLEKISTFTDIISSQEDRNAINRHITPMIENILTKLSEGEKLLKTQTFKIFLGKLFNFVTSSMILRIFPLQILDFDICSEEYTENSKVWIISYIEKFLRNDSQQTLKEFYESFTETIEDLEKAILKLKSSRQNDGMMMLDNEDGMEIEDDERFIFNRNESAHIRSIKVKRYELILEQVWGLATKYTRWNESYEDYVKEMLKKFEFVINSYNKESNGSIFIPNIRDVIFKVIGRIINNSFRLNDLKTLEVIKKDGKIFFSKCLSMIVNQKLANSEMKESFNLVASFCRIMSEKFLFKIICDMIEKFDKSFQNIFVINDNASNKAKLNESLNISINEDMNVEIINGLDIKDTNTKKTKSDNKKKTKDKEVNLLCLRIEIINYILKNIKISTNTNNVTQPESNLFSLLNSFFEKFFFNERLNNIQSIRKKLIDLFMILMGKIENSDQIIDTFSKFINEYKGLDNLSAKQKAKIFEMIIEILLKKLNDKQDGTTIDISECFSQLHILIEIVTLTKDMNRKVRNLAYEMIGKVTDFMTESNLFNEWIKMILAILASNSSFLKSASINALARIFWQKRQSADGHLHGLLQDTSSVILLLLKDNNKEITKSVFLFIRVLLYLNKNLFSGTEDTAKFIHKVVHSIFDDSNEEIKKEFKVKIRNLLKNLIIKFSYEEIKNLVPKETESLLAYINKHVVKKIKTMTKEEESVYGAGVKLDHSVMMDNDENLLDEEEEYIEKEFKKLEKRRNEEEKFYERLEKFNLDEDDPELVKKKNEVDNKKNEKMDKIDQLFNKDKIELENFFYVNPYATVTNKEKHTAELRMEKEKDSDVFFDKKKGKLVVKDHPVTLKDSLGGKKTPKPDTSAGASASASATINNDFNAPIDKNKFLKQKRVQNVARDRFDDDEDNEITGRAKRKITHSKEKTVERGKRRETHIVKFSGDEYKNKSGKGDKLMSGKYEPFAYIQLNPKTTSHKRRTESLKLFEGVMHPEKKKK